MARCKYINSFLSPHEAAVPKNAGNMATLNSFGLSPMHNIPNSYELAGVKSDVNKLGSETEIG